MRVALALLLVLCGPMLVPALAVQDVSPRHHVELFTTAARQSADGKTWIVPVHAWVYTPQNSRVRKAALAALLKARHGLVVTPQTQANFDRRANLLFADNHRGRRVMVKIAGRQFELPATGPNGHARAEIELAARDIAGHAREDHVAVEVVLPPGDDRKLAGISVLVPLDGISVISDIDDTVKISNVTDHARLFDSTCFKDFAVVPGMAALFSGWARQGVALHFVSSSPWHLYAPLREMLDGAGFPPASLDLKQIRLKDTSILDLFKDASRTKPPAIEALLAAYPSRRFALVGDSGELDPEVYADFVRRYPQRIVQVLIRNVTEATPGDDRFSKVFAGIAPALWQLFDEPAQIRWRPQ
jgi:Uncharacterized conserved protein (DUF2183)